MSDDLVLAYLAGFFDGEGSIYPRNGLQVSATQIDRRPLDILAQRFGGRVLEHRPAAISPRWLHRWVIYGKPAAAVLRAMIPHLIVKAQQASWALSYDALVWEHGGRRVPEETKIERERLRQLIMSDRTGHVHRREDRGWA